MQQKSIQISEKDNELQLERAELDNRKFELERERSKLNSDLHTLEQRKQDLAIKTKAFENMRFSISKEMSTFEEEKSTFFKSNILTSISLGQEGKPSRTGQFISDSKQTCFDKDLFKRDVSPVKVKTNPQGDMSGKFNLNN